MAEGAELYEQDFVAWTEQQAARIRAAAASQGNLPIDWENVAEEIESLGKSDRRELGSRLETIIEHLLKLQYSPASQPRAGWLQTVLRERGAVADLLEQSPSLHSSLAGLLRKANARAVRNAAAVLKERGEAAPLDLAPLVSRDLTDEEVLGEWLPVQGKSRL